ncbi:hypothetical protein S40285_10159 [Stachybotrys chlorohalonatus IBT 40285]|uniref:Uncharacterized protein n=1 Tax=Stachybotrys chlorohalonatus (strain IBT 40285) TaxID=1283841 RepID=A0A084QL06_STAC4|nr:hypothetical protein S40285_10159 [Stachybotrys chlorohalonata IBT 40285]
MEFVSPLSMTSWHYISELLEEDGHHEAAGQFRSIHEAEDRIYAAVGRWCKDKAKKAFNHVRKTVNITRTAKAEAALDKEFIVDGEPIMEAMQMSQVKDLDRLVCLARNRKQSSVDPEKVICITLKERETPDDSSVGFDEKHCQPPAKNTLLLAILGTVCLRGYRASNDK